MTTTDQRTVTPVAEQDELPSGWRNWRWQQQNSIKDADTLRAACGGWSESTHRAISDNLSTRKVQVTPYYARLIRSRAEPIEQNPLWRQVVPYWAEEGETAFDGETENWEDPSEMVNSVCQHKYDDRVLLRSINVCNAYCQFCFEALRTIDTQGGKAGGGKGAFEDSYRYIRDTAGIKEVIFSGGDPLMMADGVLSTRLADVRAISPDLLIRVHSRSLTFNPFRVTDELVEAMARHEVNSFGVHVAHPAEITEDFVTALRKVQSAVPIMLANIPLLRGVNADEDTLRELFLKLYKVGVKPYYLYHYMPHSPGASEYRSSVREAIAIMRRLKRRVTNVAMPEYALPHIAGKFTVPLLAPGESAPQFVDIDGVSHYTFTNWRGQQCRWFDGARSDA